MAVSPHKYLATLVGFTKDQTPLKRPLDIGTCQSPNIIKRALASQLGSKRQKLASKY